MFCEKCGKQIPDNSSFCEHCGAKIEGLSTNRPQQNAGQTQTTPQYSKKSNTSGKRNGKAAGIIAAVSVVAVILIMVVVFFSTYKKKINLADYITVNYYGYDAFGTADISFDYEKFYGDLQKKSRKLKTAANTNNIDSLDDILSVLDSTNISAYGDLCSDLEWKLDKSDNLSNGDTVNVSFSFNNEKAKKYGIKYIGKTEKYTVDGLEEITELDPFADISLEFSGTSPNVSVSLNNNSSNETVQALNFDISPNSNIKKGDTVTVNVENDETSLLENYGCKLTSTSKEFTCDNVDEYISTLSDLDKETLSSMQSQSSDVINSYFANNKAYIAKSNLKYAGCYFLYRKKTDSWSSQNIIYVIYRANVKSKNKSFKNKVVYFPIKFDNIIKYADGSEYVDLDSTSIEGTTNLSTGWWSHVSGYTSKKNMYSELVASRKGEYIEDDSDGLK